MRAKKMTAKREGTCLECDGPIVPGHPIWWQRGRGAWHVDCQTASYTADNCTACNGLGAQWNNRPCPACDGTGSRKVQQAAKGTINE